MKQEGKRILLLFLCSLLCIAGLDSCTAWRMRAKVRESKTVVLDIGHYYHPERGGQGARTPSAKYGAIEECEFWYMYAGYVKDVIEQAGYTCIITNRGATPADPKLAAQAEKLGVKQINTPEVGAVYRSKQHPKRMAVGMLSVNYALDQNPACVVFLHHNSHSDTWEIWNKGAFYRNREGETMATKMATVMNERILDKGMPNGGEPCRIIIRTDGRRGGGDWLNACEESYVPAVITEVAFLSNPEHAKFLSKKKNAIRYAQAIGEGIVTFLNAR